jgi:hypothetical protein
MSEVEKSNKRSQKDYFKTRYYNNNEEYRKKHLAYVNEKIKCECGCITSRCNLTKHKRTAKHLQFMEKEQRIQELAKFI